MRVSSFLVSCIQEAERASWEKVEIPFFGLVETSCYPQRMLGTLLRKPTQDVPRWLPEGLRTLADHGGGRTLWLQLCPQIVSGIHRGFFGADLV